VDWPLYIERGGFIGPMEIFSREEKQVPIHQVEFFQFQNPQDFPKPKVG